MSAFAIVVEGSSIYNFGIHIFSLLSSKFPRKPRSKSHWPAFSRAVAPRRCSRAERRPRAPRQGGPGARTPRAWAPCGGREGVGCVPLSSAPVVAPVGPPLSASCYPPRMSPRVVLPSWRRKTPQFHSLAIKSSSSCLTPSHACAHPSWPPWMPLPPSSPSCSLTQSSDASSPFTKTHWSSSWRTLTRSSRPHRSRCSSGRRRLPLLHAVSRAAPTPTPATNRPWVSPRPYSTPPRPSPVSPSPEFGRSHRPSWPKGHIARSWVFSGCFVRIEGIFVKPEKIPGTCRQKWFLNSDGFWLNIVNFVENHIKFKKMKTNFFGFLLKNPTTFVKHDHAFSW
jgi:hypothetical protein